MAQREAKGPFGENKSLDAKFAKLAKFRKGF